MTDLELRDYKEQHRLIFIWNIDWWWLNIYKAHRKSEPVSDALVIVQLFPCRSRSYRILQGRDRIAYSSRSAKRAMFAFLNCPQFWEINIFYFVFYKMKF